MNKYFIALLAFSFAQIILAKDTSKRVVCYFDSDNFLRRGNENFTQYDLENALPLCTHLVYGYAGINRDTKTLFEINGEQKKLHYNDITVMKVVFPDLKVYLSVGGDRDEIDGNKYIQLLKDRKSFVADSIQYLKKNRFDGLDLAFQFPRDEEVMENSKAELIKENFTGLVQALHEEYAKENLSLALSVLPNVNSTHYLDIPKIYDKFEYINLFAFDFSTPERNPKEADYTAPIYFLNEQNRLPYKTVDFQVQYWLKNGCPADKLNLGIPTFARTWKTTEGSGTFGIPVIFHTAGPGVAGIHTKKEGLLSYTEVCERPYMCKSILQYGYGSYSLCRDNFDSDQLTWMAYDSPDFAAKKAKYAKKMGLGGVAVVDLSYDDFEGVCENGKYPILNSIKNYM